MEVLCPSRNTRIPGEDMNLAHMVAKCNRCGILIDQGRYSRTDASDTKPRAAPEGPRIPRPSSIRVYDAGDELVIVRRWFTPAFIFLAFFCIAWDSFLVFWFSTVTGNNVPWIFVVFPIAHVAVGVGLTYYVLAGFLNVTILRVTTSVLNVRHGPVPWTGNRTLPADEIDQLFTVQKSSTTKQGSVVSTEQCVENHLGIKDRRVPGEVAR